MSQYLGDISAYALAVSQGYTGTEEEYAELMASYATVGQTAVTAAQTATTKASEAATSATTATNKATEATTAATTATTKAGEASTSASTATSAKDTAVSASQTATTKATEATTAAATAVSAKDDAVSANTAAQSAKTAAQTAQAGAETAAASVQSSAEQIATNAADISQLKSEKADTTDMLKAFPTDSIQGAVASFSDGAEIPLKSLVVDIDPVQDLHGQANPYPAGGGKNLLDYDTALTSIGFNVQSDGSWCVATSSTVDSKILWENTSGIEGAVSLSYTYKNNSATSQGVRFKFVYADSTTKENYVAASESYVSASFTSNASKTLSRITCTYGTGSVATWVKNIQVESGAATAYAPYSNICPISGWSEVNVNACGINVWDEEWEEGGLNISDGQPYASTGKIRSKNFISVTQNTQYYFVVGNSYENRTLLVHAYDSDKNYIRLIQYINDSNGWNITAPSGCCYIKFASVAGNITTYNHDISINYPATDHDYHPYSGQSINIALGQTVYGGKLDVTNGVLTTYPYYASYNGETLTGDWISDRDKYVSETTPTTGAQVVNIGGAGTDVQLDPHEVTALLGSNNVWADTGDSKVEYRADPTLYISRLTEPDADMVADANITSGQYFMVGNTLYKATANIASGGAITPNVNCTRKSLSEALNELNS